MADKPTFEQRFRRFSAARRRVLNAALGYRLGTQALAALAAALLLLSGWLANVYVNAALFVLLVAGLVALGIVFVCRRHRFRSCLEEAFFMESLAGHINSRLISAWDFHEQGMDSPLTRVVIEHAAADLEIPFEEKLDRRDRDRRRRRFLVGLAAVVVLGCLPWCSLAQLYRNACRTWLALGDALFPVAYSIEPAAGRHIYKLGENVPVKFRLARRVYDQVTLVSTRGEKTERKVLPLSAAGEAVTQVTSATEAEYAVRIAFGRRETPEVRLVFTTAPVLQNMQTELVYPAYTRMLPRTLEGVQSRLVGLVGTRITMGFTFSKPIESATIAWDDGETLPLDVIGRFASTTILHNRPRRASLQVRDAFGIGMEFPALIDFEVQNDEKPRLYLPRHLKDDMPMLAKDVPLFGFGVRAEDDFGVTRCVLRWQKSTVENPGQILERGEIERLVSPAQRKAVISFDKAFAGLALQPGDKLTFIVDAYDNCMPDRQVTHARPASIFLYREELGGLTIKDLGFGRDAAGFMNRIAKSQRATSVQEPEGIQVREKVRNEFEGSVASSTRASLVRGEFGQAARDYFRLLSGVTLKDEPGPTPVPK